MMLTTGVANVRSTLRTRTARLGAALALLVAGAVCGHAAPSPVYENTGVASSPVIDATTFLNRGRFTALAFTQPYETQNTLHYTNFSGAVIDGDGIWFAHVTEDGVRRPAATFRNDGKIAMDSLFQSGPVFGGIGAVSFANSCLLVDATNVVNRGGLEVGSSGQLRIRGQDAPLARSGLRAGENPKQPINPGSVLPPDFYSNVTGVQDLTAGAGTNNGLDPATPGPFDPSVLTQTP